MNLIEYYCAEQFIMASKAGQFGDDTALSAILALIDSREQKRLGRHVRHFDPAYGKTDAKPSSFEQNYLRTKRCVLP